MVREILIVIREALATHLFAVGGTPVTVATLVTLVIIGIATFWASRLAQRAAQQMLGLAGVADKGSLGVARRVVHYATLVIGVGIGAQTLGINLGALFAAGAVFAVAIGFATQNIFENFASGLILLGERTIKPHDVLEVEGQTVEVVRMGFRSTVCRSRDEEEIILPNSVLVQSAVKNFTLQDSLYRLRTQVGVTYDSDMKRVTEVLSAAAASMPWRVDAREPVVLMTQFGNSSVDFDVSVWIEDPWHAPALRSQLNEAIWWGLKAAGIVIAFPQVDVHLDARVLEALRRRAEHP